MDRKDIHPGEIWKSSIQKAIRDSDFFLACLSTNSVNKRGFLQVEIREALDIWQEKLGSDIYLIPVRLEDCGVSEPLCHFQWVNLFEKNGWAQLVDAIQVGMERRAGATRPIIRESPSPIVWPETGIPQPPRKSPRFRFRIDYEYGLHQLRELLEGQPPDVQNELHTLEARLLENLKDEHLYGSNEAVRADRSRVIYSLNRLMVRVGLKVSFVDLCQ